MFLTIIVSVGVTLLLISMFLKNMVFVPVKIENPCGEILIEDRINVIRDQASLEHRMQQFYGETGVTPAVLTVPDSEINGSAEKLPSYALDAYYDRCQDEKHWIIVYAGGAKGEWAFEGGNWG